MKKKKYLGYFIVVLVMIALVASTYLWRELVSNDKLKEQEVLYQTEIANLKAMYEVPKSDVYVFSRSLQEGHKIQDEDVMLLTMDTALVPERIISAKEEVVGKTLKIDISMQQTVDPYIAYMDEDIPNDLRIREFSSFIIPSDMDRSGKSVDVRIRFPSGQDYIVMSKKIITKINRTYNESNIITNETVWMHLNESEMTYISTALIDAYLNGAEIYMAQYVEPYIQKAALVNYPLNFAVLELLSSNPGLLDEAEIALQLSNRKSLEEVLTELKDQNTANFSIPDIETPTEEESDDLTQTENTTDNNTQDNTNTTGNDSGLFN